MAAKKSIDERTAKEAENSPVSDDRTIHEIYVDTSGKVYVDENGNVLNVHIASPNQRCLIWPSRSSANVSDEKLNEIFDDLLSACEQRIRDEHSAYESELAATGKNDARMLDDGIPIGGNYLLPPWETSPLVALALDVEIAGKVALKHGVSAAHVIELGALNLSNETGFSPAMEVFANDFLIRSGLRAHADLIRTIANEREALQQIQQTKDAQRKDFETRSKIMREQVQPKGSDKSSTKAHGIVAELKRRFNAERKRNSHLGWGDLCQNVAADMNEKVDAHGKTWKTFMGNAFTRDKVMRTLAPYKNRLMS